jgi:hypothetical protein
MIPMRFGWSGGREGKGREGRGRIDGIYIIDIDIHTTTLSHHPPLPHLSPRPSFTTASP